jgi:peptidyl-dipeptidase A
MSQEIPAFIRQHEQTTLPLSIDYSIKFWELSISGTAEREQALVNAKERYLRVYSDAADFRRLRAWQSSGEVARLSAVDARVFKLIYDSYVPNQIEPDILRDIIERETEIENLFNTFRAEFEGGQASDNHLREILHAENHINRRRAAWEASKQVGQAVAPKLLDLIRIRNREARKLGYSDYYSMMFELQELDEAWVFSLFDRLETLSRSAFADMKRSLDGTLKRKYGISEAESYPWLYADPFFQEFPSAGAGESLDDVFKGRDIVSLTRAHYESIGLEIDGLLKSADLYEREGKSQHAFCLDVDHAGDVRVLCNIRDNERWTSTMLHEFGHAVYDKYHDPALPFTLRTPAHILTTEAIAMLNGRMSKNPEWLAKIAGLSAADASRLSETAFQTLRSEMLIFLRWALTLVRFERELYRNPERDLNRLWWEFVERYQLVTPPEGRDLPDWASKNHLATSPAYYQNYVLGELMASQLLGFIHTEVVKAESYIGNPEVGAYLKRSVFEPGARAVWSDMISQATGGRLTPDHFIRQFVENSGNRS